MLATTTPAPWRPSTSGDLQREIDATPSVAVTRAPDGPAVVESFVVIDPDGAHPAATVIGRLPDGLSVADALLPDALKNANPLGLARLVDGITTRESLA